MTDALKERIKEKYGEAARVAASGSQAACCGGDACCGDVITGRLYPEAETAGLPHEALAASLGCGNPTALVDLRRGDYVLDLGSGGGIDVLLSANRVGPTGRVYGLDMTDDMLSLARENARRAGATNVEFLKGDIESIPLPSASVDVVISNCVINLSPDKPRVLREAFRVLKPGGRFAVSDVVVRSDVPDEIRRNVELWIGCVAGALHEREYVQLLADAGFADVSVEPWRVYRAQDAAALCRGMELDAATVAAVDGAFASAFVRARKPEAQACCSPGCCGN